MACLIRIDPAEPMNIGENSKGMEVEMKEEGEIEEEEEGEEGGSTIFLPGKEGDYDEFTRDKVPPHVVKELVRDGYPAFDDPEVMTITMMSVFDGNISSIKNMFYLLPITRIYVKKPTRRVSKIKLPYPGQAGIVMTAKLGNEVRGIVKTRPKGLWEHSIMSDISTSDKNVNMKISHSNINMCGAKSVDMGVEATHLMLSHINKVHNSLLVMREYPQTAMVAIRYVLDQCRTELVNGESVRGYQDWQIGFNVNNIGDLPFTPQSIELKDIKEGENLERLSTIANQIVAFLYHELTDVFTNDDAVHKIRWMCGIDPVITQELKYSGYRVGMTKYRYYLNFNVNLSELDRLLPMCDKDFTSNYFPAVRTYAKIEIGCSSRRYSLNETGNYIYIFRLYGEKGYKYVYKTKPSRHRPAHTFSVSRNGHVAHSCPFQEEMEYMYYKFIRAISSIRPHIEVINPT